jgi:14-3-3 protein epsilon
MASPNLEGLSIHGEEEVGFTFDFEEEGDEQVDLKWCLVGRFLCNRPIHFKSMKVRMADLWRPVKGVTIKEAKAGLFLFSFAHPLDMDAVLNGGPWTFDNNMLIMDRVQLGMQIESISLFHVDFWVQIHNLPAGFMKETVGVKLRNYIGTFIKYDKNNNSRFWRQHMRVRVKLDVRRPLKKDSKVRDKEGAWCTVNFKYEKLGVFCFVCGIKRHAKNNCEVRFTMENDDGRREWSGEIRADQRRGGGRQTLRWLREEGDGGNRMSGSERMNQGRSTVVIPTMEPAPADMSATASGPSSHNHNTLITNYYAELSTFKS